MNDVYTPESVEQDLQAATNNASDKRRPVNGYAHLVPSRWWFFSSVFPMIAGTFGPVASAYSVCALVQPWRQHLVPGGNVENAPYIADPQWLTIANAIQLAVAIISNLFLLFNMARRVRFSLAQPVTIIGWYISAVCLIALTATASGPLRQGLDFPTDELIWSQSFYFGIWAAILYFVDASLMTLTFWGASIGHYEKDFMLTVNQRTLMLQTVMLLMYIHLGAGVFSKIEGWNYLNGIYWANVTLFTVGFGDYSPQTTLGKALLIPYAVIGIISLGLVINAVRNLTLEGGKRQIAARMEEKRRRRVVQTITRRGDDDILNPIREEEHGTPQPDKVPATEFERRKIEFSLMRKIQAQSLNRRRWMAIAISTSLWLILWLVGAIVFEKFEKRYQNWTYFDAFYFCFTAWTTIGYGDMTPISNAGKSFFVFWSLLALPTMTVLISHAGDTVVKFMQNTTIRVGNVTILPGEEGFVFNVKHIISRVTFGRVFPSCFQSAPLQLSNRPKSTDQSLEETMTESEKQNFPTSNNSRPITPDADEGTSESRQPRKPRRASLALAYRIRRSLSHIRNPHLHLPTGHDFRLLLISEIRAVAKHLNEPNPHQYTFDEWAWYLKLLGEDEHNPQTHSKATHKVQRRDLDAEHASQNLTWSWVGHRNPLLGSQEETEWILERLADKLEESLMEESKRHWGSKTKAGREVRYINDDSDGDDDQDEEEQEE